MLKEFIQSSNFLKEWNHGPHEVFPGLVQHQGLLERIVFLGLSLLLDLFMIFGIIVYTLLFIPMIPLVIFDYIVKRYQSQGTNR